MTEQGDVGHPLARPGGPQIVMDGWPTGDGDTGTVAIAECAPPDYDESGDPHNGALDSADERCRCPGPHPHQTKG